MRFQSSLPLAWATLNALYMSRGASAASATDVLDFKSLILPNTKEPIPLGELGGATFENIKLTKLAGTGLGSSLGSGLPSVLDLVAGTAGSPESTIAFIDSPAGGVVRPPPGKRIESMEFFCCSGAKGESVLEGKGCKQMACKVTLENEGEGSGDRIRQEARFAPLDTVGTAPDGVVRPSIFLGEQTAGTAARAVAITVTSARAGLRRRWSASGAGEVVLGITQIVLAPVDEWA
ncbi:hypothetical protein DRE_03361 [Drechslerella stenobrocha 248]|uniref:Uncharacterized protein n=1 Tax=Drechslerella stenobrocha 248 TaxID=1043628 RepID=W7I477_9PEZI|nr:hypothetical protein DRE_03361 [Drechslerella stenobrocha 248]